MSRAYEIDQAILADVVQFGFGKDGNWRPWKVPDAPETTFKYIYNPCTDTFDWVEGPPFPVVDRSCGEEPVEVLTKVPAEAITAKALNASVERVTADPEAVGPLLMAGAEFQRLAEFHRNNGRDGPHELLDATAGELFAEAINRMRAARQ